jgi:putative transposase
VVNDSPELLNMMEDSLAIYDQALYYQRQEYFKGRNNNEKYKVYSYNDLWNIVKDTSAYKDSTLDIGPKTYAIRQVVKNWKAYMKSLKEFYKDPSKFEGKPRIPNYLHRTKKYNVAQIDSSRFRTKWCKENEIRLPNTQYKVQIPEFIKLKDVHMIFVKKYYNKIKIGIVYEDLKYIDNEYDKGSSMGIDLGLNNLCAITINDKSKSYVIKGSPLKSINQYYNKKNAKIQSDLSILNDRKYSKRLDKLNRKRNNKIYNFIHNTANRIIELALENKIETIYVGHNKEWKQDIKLGNNKETRKRNNQNFVDVPFNMLIDVLTYKVEKYLNLNIKIVEESYTSKCDHLIKESMEHHEVYAGKRKYRGLFISSTGKYINADINGAIGILRKGKAITDDQIMILRDRGDIVSPKVLNINP